nr:MAG TPA: hypothetical protein [Caudoviricetes sp.]
METEESTSFYLLLREMFFVRETPCILQGVFLMQFNDTMHSTCEP